MAKLLTNTRVYGTATVDTVLFVNGGNTVHSTATGALRIIGGLGVAGGGFFSGVVTATSFVGAISGTASLATDLAGGTAGQLVYQISPNDSGFVGPGTAGQILVSAGAAAPVYTNTSSIYVNSAVNAQNIFGGTAGQLHYQSSAGVTAFAGPGTSGQVLTSGGSGAPTYVNTSSLHVGRAVVADSFSGNAGSATNLTGGTAGQVPYQTGPSATSFYGPGTAGQILVSAGAAAPVYTNTSSIYINRATLADNDAGGAAGGLRYQTAANASTFLSIGTAGQVLTVNSSANAPQWTSTSSFYAGFANQANNIRGGSAGQLVYQSAANTSAFVGPGTAGQILVSAGASAPVYTNTGSIYVNRAVLADSATSASAASAATNISGGTAGQVPYQTSAGATSFFGPGTAGQILVSAGTSAPVYTSTGSIYVNRSTVADNASLLNGISAIGLFNNMGQAHGARTSFDATTPSYDFGFRYVQGTANGPGTGGGVPGQFYSWYIGLGSEYPATGSGSYGAMFAVDRNSTTPYLSVRYNENNSFSSWRKIHAGYADSAGSSGSVTSQAQTANSSYFLTFVDSNNTTAAGENLFTTSTLTINPSTGNVGVGSSAVNSKLTVGPDFASIVGITVDTGNTTDAAFVVRKAASKPAFGILPWDGEVYLSAGTYYDGGSWVHHSDNNNNILYVLDPGGGARWYASNNGTSSWNLASNIQLWNDSANWTSLVQSTRSGDSYFTGGNFGVGTSSPAAKLHVDGGSGLPGRLVSSGFSGIEYHNVNGTWKVYVGTETGGGGARYNSADSVHTWYNNSTGEMRLNSTGLGVGTISPSYKLHVAGKIYSSTEVQAGTAILGDSGSFTLLGSNSSGRGIAIARDANASSYPDIIVSSSGNVGMGTSSPSYKLDVAGQICMHDEAQDIDDRYYGGTFLRGWQSFSAGSNASITYTTDSTCPVGVEVASVSTYVWARGPRLRLDNTQNYEVELWVKRHVSNTAGTFYFVVSNYDSSGNVISGDGTDWNYPAAFTPSTTWTKYRFVVGPYGGAKNHSGSARYISVGFIANYTAGNDVIYMTGFKCRVIPRYNNDPLTIYNNGNVGIGNTAPAEKLHVTGNMVATGEITAYYSDRRLKDNVETLSNAVDKVKALNGIKYTPNELAVSLGHKKDKKLVGLFADEVESVLPEAVRLAPFDVDPSGNSKSGENYKTIQYEKLVPLLIEAIKEQQKQIDELKSKLDQNK